MVLHIILPPLILAFAFVYATNAYLQKIALKKSAFIRAKSTLSIAWKIQFMLRPVMVFSFLYYASNNYHYSSSVLLSLAFVPFVFNWGIEPWEIPKDVYFRTFFYLHYFAIIFQLLWFQLENQEKHLLHVSSASSPTSTMVANGNVILSKSIAISLLYAHIWLLYPIRYLDHLKYINKQNWFWWYVCFGFILNLYYWNAVMSKIDHPTFFSWDTLPLYLHYVTRWSLHIRMEQLINSGLQNIFIPSPHFSSIAANEENYLHVPINRSDFIDVLDNDSNITANNNNNNNNKIKDHFEERKQKHELIGLIVAYIFSYCIQYYINAVMFIITFIILQFYFEW
jgi:hypothetical protein